MSGRRSNQTSASKAGIPSRLAIGHHCPGLYGSLCLMSQAGEKDFVLYFPGDNGQDDSGFAAQLGEKKTCRRIWVGHHAVWAAAAAPEEAKLALSATKHD
jgi:hypothetical protein